MLRFGVACYAQDAQFIGCSTTLIIDPGPDELDHIARWDGRRYVEKPH